MSHRFYIATCYAEKRWVEAGRDLSALPEPLQIVCLVTWAQGPIDNGGLYHFFSADFVGRPEYGLFIRAYRQIGAHTAADRLEAALRRIPLETPHLMFQRRFEWLLANAAAIEQLDDGICGNPDVYPLLEEYIEAHADAFCWDEPKPIGPTRRWLP